MRGCSFTWGHSGICLPERPAGPLRSGSEARTRSASLSSRLDSSLDADRTQVMTMQFLRETPEDRVLGIGGDTLDDELSAATPNAREGRSSSRDGPAAHRSPPAEGRVAIGYIACRWRATDRETRYSRARSTAWDARPLRDVSQYAPTAYDGLASQAIWNAFPGSHTLHRAWNDQRFVARTTSDDVGLREIYVDLDGERCRDLCTTDRPPRERSRQAHAGSPRAQYSVLANGCNRFTAQAPLCVHRRESTRLG